MDWLDKTGENCKVGVWVFPGVPCRERVLFLLSLQLETGSREDRTTQLGPRSSCFLLILIWARHGCRATTIPPAIVTHSQKMFGH